MNSADISKDRNKGSMHGNSARELRSGMHFFENRQAIAEMLGYTLIETTVAFALFATVLLPIGTILLKRSTSRYAAQRIEALSIAQEAMERAVEPGALRAENNTYMIADKWVVEVDFTSRGNLVLINVHVRSRRTGSHTLSLMTARLRPYEDRR